MGNSAIAKLWKTKFSRKILSIIFDEAHCISYWGDFRSEYKYLGDLHFQINNEIPFYAVSATLPPPVMADIKGALRLRDGRTVHLQRTVDRPDISLMVHPFTYTISSFRDLDFLVPKIPDGYKEGDELTVRKFVVFFDSMMHAQQAVKHLQSLLPDALKHKIIWFHSTMTPEFRKDATASFRDSDLWGLCATDAFGMVSALYIVLERYKCLPVARTASLKGMDLPDIEIVVQWKATCTLCTLWQRFGRGARGNGYRATAILLVEKKHIRLPGDADPVEEASKAEKSVRKKRKASTDIQPESFKRPALSDRSINVSHAPQVMVEIERGCKGISDVSAVPHSAIAECHRRYARLEIGSKKGKNDAFVKGSAMDDYINAQYLFNCRRDVLKVYFNPDERRK